MARAWVVTEDCCWWLMCDHCGFDCIAGSSNPIGGTFECPECKTVAIIHDTPHPSEKGDA